MCYNTKAAGRQQNERESSMFNMESIRNLFVRLTADEKAVFISYLLDLRGTPNNGEPHSSDFQVANQK